MLHIENKSAEVVGSGWKWLSPESEMACEGWERIYSFIYKPYNNVCLSKLCTYETGYNVEDNFMCTQIILNAHLWHFL